MDQERKLVLEHLSGPLDGASFTLEAGAEWSRSGEGPLSFPWDATLGAPQARLTIEGTSWWLESLDTCDAPCQIGREQQLEDVRSKVQLKAGDILGASHTWLLVRRIE